MEAVLNTCHLLERRNDQWRNPCGRACRGAGAPARGSAFNV